MKAFKRNAVIITVLLFVAVAVYLNWSYSRNEEELETSADTEKTDLEKEAAITEDGDAEESTELYFTDEDEETSAETESSDYFAQARLERSQARDAATETLKVITETEGASQETIDDALADMSSIAAWTEQEAEIESLITAKGFSECVVYISEDGVTVTVATPEEGMSSTAIAKITDVVTSETGCAAADIKIVEIDQ
jgi:stage III sporulation protein AH